MRRLRAATAIALLWPFAGYAQKEKAETPRITALAPLHVSPGSEVTLKIRGVKLSAATEVRFPGARIAPAVELKEKKSADVPQGFDAKLVGDTQVEAKLTVPAELPNGVLQVRVVTPGGDTPPRELRVIGRAACADEKEPNNGFREAQPLEPGKPVRGVVEKDKDVDVYQFAGRAGQRIAVEVFAARGASLLDPALTLFDTRGNILATCDDSGETRDAQCTAQLPSDGPVFIVLQDAHDRGGAWHGYELRVKEAK